MGEEESNSPQKTHQKGFIEELLGDVFNLDRGLPGTIWAMIKSPGKVVDAHFTDRGKYVSPVRYCIIILAVTTFISVRFIDYGAMMQNAMELGVGEGNDFDQMVEQLSTLFPSFDWAAYFQAINDLTVTVLQKFQQIIYLVLLAPLFALFSRLFFKKKEPAFLNHYVLMVYSLTTFSLFAIALLPLLIGNESTENVWTFLISAPLMFVFLVWSMTSYLKLKRLSEYLKAIIALFIGYISYAIISGILMYVGAYIKVVI